MIACGARIGSWWPGSPWEGLPQPTSVLHHPELAARAIVQSGSFWLGSERRGEGEGELVSWLRHRSEARGLQRPKKKPAFTGW